jgi:DHA2 family multidrug resistance protein
MAQEPLRGPGLALVTVALSLGVFMNVLDLSIANVSIPFIAGDLGVSVDQGTWVITSFAVTTAIGMPLTGWLAARFGEVRLFCLCTALFALVSFLCGLSTNMTELIALRALQGAVAGPMIPLSQSVLLSNYPAQKRGLALGIWSTIAVVGPVCGPILGGWLTDNYSWPWIFYINVPLGLASALVTWRLLRTRETAIVRRPIDAVGIGLLAIGLGCLQVLLDRGEDLDWFGSPLIVALAVASVVALSYLVVWELTAANPVVDLSLFSRRNYAIGCAALSFGMLLYFGNVVIFPLWLQTQMGYTATWAGLATATIGILPVLLTPLVGRNIQRLDLRVIVSLAFLIFAAVSFWNAGFDVDVDFRGIALPRFIQGAALACFFVPLITMAFSGLPPSRLASASGLLNALRTVGGSFGTSLSITLWDRRESFHRDRLAEHVTALNPDVLRRLDEIHAAGVPDPSAWAVVNGGIVRQAYMLATADFFWLSGCLFLGLLLVWFARPPFSSAAAAASE